MWLLGGRWGWWRVVAWRSRRKGAQSWLGRGRTCTSVQGTMLYVVITMKHEGLLVLKLHKLRSTLWCALFAEFGATVTHSRLNAL